MTGSQGQDTSEALARCRHCGEMEPGRKPCPMCRTEAEALADILRVAVPQDYNFRAKNLRGRNLEVAQAVLAAGWVSPADHQRALAAERERVLQEAADALGTGPTMRVLVERESCDWWTDRPVANWLRDRAAIARGNPHTEESP